VPGAVAQDFPQPGLAFVSDKLLQVFDERFS